MTEPIRGKIARVFSAQEIALNIGTAKGVTVGMHFDVMDAREAISDPDTGEALGSIERPKVRVEIIYAQEKLSIARTYPMSRVHKSESAELRIPAFGPVARAFIPPSWVKRYENPEKMQETRDTSNQKNNHLQIGDTVVQVLKVDEPQQESINSKLSRTK